MDLRDFNHQKNSSPWIASHAIIKTVKGGLSWPDAENQIRNKMALTTQIVAMTFGIPFFRRNKKHPEATINARPARNFQSVPKAMNAKPAVSNTELVTNLMSVGLKVFMELESI